LLLVFSQTEEKTQHISMIFVDFEDFYAIHSILAEK
jgi:hypothetical protein